MEKEMLELISKNLPAQVGDVLQKRLLRASELEKEMAIMREQNKNQAEVVLSLQRTIDEYRLFDERNKLMDTREKALITMETTAKVTALEHELRVEKEKAGFMRDVTMGLVRNTEYRDSVYTRKEIPVRDNNGYHSIQLGSDSTHTERKAE